MTVTHCDDVPCVDVPRLYEAITGVPHAQRLRTILRQAGCEFHDPDGRFVKTSRVLLAALGGIMIRVSDDGVPTVGRSTLAEHVQDARKTMACAGMLSYLNPNDKDEETMWSQLVATHGVPSTAHIPQISVLVAGLSVKAELELCCQRDIVHLSRLTSARTAAQDDPPIRVEDERMLGFYQEMLANRPKNPGVPREAFNSMMPLSKCSVLLISGGLKNMLKLAAMRHDTGKEAEVRDICGSVHAVITGLYPEFSGA